jgi:hypothetical protein
MLAITHLLVGAVIGKYFQNPYLIIALAIISHYFLDFIPHYSLTGVKGFKEKGLRGTDKKDLTRKGIEPIVGFLLTFFFAFTNKPHTAFILLGALASWFPDFLQVIGWKYDILFLRKYIPRPGNKLYKISKSKWWIAFQALIVIISIIALSL